ncbi:MAG: hypothetical protein JXI43_10610 [Tissierellales bacterium]|nr:hypothetical protein [Tissierellales bacterium]
MSKRARSVQWCEGRILDVLGKSIPGKYPTFLALSAMAMNYEVRSNEEQHNFDFALYNLIKQGLVIKTQDEKGFNVVKLAA